MQKQLRCVIAAGGTAGHVLPALAVAEALTARGVYVTFAGSPDRVEAQLVPDAGYELDTFRISGFPRQPSPALVKSLYRAGVSPHACRAILKRRRCDIVFGAGGYVAGPMVFAAGTLRTSRCALRGGRSPRAREPDGAAVREACLPGVPARGGWPSRGSASSAGRFPRAPERSRRPRRARSSSCPPRAPQCSSRVLLLALGRSTRWRSRPSPRSARRFCISPASVTTGR